VLGYIFRRLLAGLVTLVVVTFLVSSIIRLVPGDPVQIMYAQSQSTGPAQIEAMRHYLGLDRPIYEQYLKYMRRLLEGDWGTTIRGEQPVLHLLLLRVPNTIRLATASLLIAIVFGGSLGVLAAYYKGGWVDNASMVVAVLGVSLPSFWLGLLLILLFALELGWLPVAGSDLRSLILPAVTLGVGNASIVARLVRSSMLDTLGQDYVRTARAKGLGEALTMVKHVLRNSLIPVVTILGLQFSYTLGGAVVVENVFAWNGVGRLAVQAILQRDYPLIQGFVLMLAVVVLTISLAVDLSYALLDPRVRYETGPAAI
jgi:ABC-type dipeptide/oligopeptide/nickel transport system permease component